MDATEAKTRLLVKRRAASAYPDMHELMTFLPCEGCGRFTDAMECHHRQNRSQGGLWLPSNIVGLCPRCHKRVTVNPKFSIEAGLTVEDFDLPSLVPVKLWYCERKVLLRDDGCYVST